MSKIFIFSADSPVRLLVLGVALAAQMSCDPDVSNLSAGGALGGSSAASGGASGAISMSGQATGGADMGGAGGSYAGTAGQLDVGGAHQVGGAGGRGGATGGGGSSVAGLLSFSDGRVSPGSKDYGIDGAWRKFGADSDLITTDFTGGSLCVKGTVKGVAGGDYGRYWGGGVQFVLRASGDPYNAAANGVAGISVILEGKSIPSPLRLKFKPSSNTDNYCQNIDVVPGSPIELTTSTAKRDCWMPGGAPVDPTALESFDLHIVPESASDISFDFCITKVTVVPS